MWGTVSGARILPYSLLFLLGKPLGFNYIAHSWPGGKLSTWHQFGFGSSLSWDWVTNLKKPNKTPSSQTLWTNVMAQDFSLYFASTWCVFGWKNQSSQHCSYCQLLTLHHHVELWFKNQLPTSFCTYFCFRSSTGRSLDSCPCSLVEWWD